MSQCKKKRASKKAKLPYSTWGESNRRESQVTNMALRVQFGPGAPAQVFPAGEGDGMEVGVRAGERGLVLTAWRVNVSDASGGGIEEAGEELGS